MAKADVWQEKRAFEETNAHMLDDNALCDVTFLMGTNKKEVKAHKFILASRSPVFYAIFCGPISETSSAIEIPDIEHDTMSSLLRFIYTEDCTVDGESALALLYAAKKYSIKRLEQKCQTFVSEQISCENVCTIFAQVHLINELELKRNCFAFILSKGTQVMRTGGFRALPKELLKEILESDKIIATEADIYDSCKQWASYQLHNADENKDASHSEIRNMLGDLLYLIRFLTMTIETFTATSSHDDILSQDEKVSIFQFFVSGSKGENFKFCDKARSVHKSYITRLTNRLYRWTNSGNTDAINFIVSKPVIFFGLGVYSPSESGTVKGDVSLLKEDQSVIVKKEVEITYASSKFHEEVLFDECVLLKPGSKYTITVAFKGPITFHGDNGLNEVTEDDCSITFSDNDASKNGTSVSRGQIPFLILGII